MTELKYSYESLQKFCNENGIELCRDYSQEVVRRETKIEGKCRNEGCNELFNKAVCHSLHDSQSSSSSKLIASNIVGASSAFILLPALLIKL